MTRLSAMPARSLAAAQRSSRPSHVWLNTATYGLPPRERVRRASRPPRDEWRHGRTGFDGWDRSVGAARASGSRG